MIHYPMNQYIPQLDDVITDGLVNYTALRSVENILTQRRRDDVLEILHQTMAGKIIVEQKKNNLDSYSFQISNKNLSKMNVRG